MSSILYVHDIIFSDPERCLSGEMKLKVIQSRKLAERLKMNKPTDMCVCDLFDDERFHGEVTEVIFHDVHTQYIYRVVCEDGDVCDYRRHEFEVIRCTVYMFRQNVV